MWGKFFKSTVIRCLHLLVVGCFPVHTLGVLQIPEEILGGSKMPCFHFINLDLMHIYMWTVEKRKSQLLFKYSQGFVFHSEHGNHGVQSVNPLPPKANGLLGKLKNIIWISMCHTGLQTFWGIAE